MKYPLEWKILRNWRTLDEINLRPCMCDQFVELVNENVGRKIYNFQILLVSLIFEISHMFDAFCVVCVDNIVSNWRLNPPPHHFWWRIGVPQQPSYLQFMTREPTKPAARASQERNSLIFHRRPPTYLRNAGWWVTNFQFSFPVNQQHLEGLAFNILQFVWDAQPKYGNK